jgi:hypothetical protein
MRLFRPLSVAPRLSACYSLRCLSLGFSGSYYIAGKCLRFCLMRHRVVIQSHAARLSLSLTGSVSASLVSPRCCLLPFRTLPARWEKLIKGNVAFRNSALSLLDDCLPPLYPRSRDSTWRDMTGSQPDSGHLVRTRALSTKRN